MKGITYMLVISVLMSNTTTEQYSIIAPHIPSETEVLTTDVFLFLTVFIIEIASIVYYHSYGKYRVQLLLLTGIFGVSASMLLFVARASVPVGFSITNNTVVYKYRYNPYSRIYLSTLALGVMILTLYMLNMLSRTVKRTIGGRTLRYRR